MKKIIPLLCLLSILQLSACGTILKKNKEPSANKNIQCKQINKQVITMDISLIVSSLALFPLFPTGITLLAAPVVAFITIPIDHYTGNLYTNSEISCPIKNNKK